MSEPIVFISRNLIREGRRAEFDSLFANAVDLIHETKPETSLFAAYVDEGGTGVAIVHAFADGAAMALHFEGSDQRSETVSDLIDPTGFEIYGPAPIAAVEQLRREAKSVGISLTIYPDLIGGFLRRPA